jgi:hypothetical protein
MPGVAPEKQCTTDGIMVLSLKRSWRVTATVLIGTVSNARENGRVLPAKGADLVVLPDLFFGGGPRLLITVVLDREILACASRIGEYLAWIACCAH